MGCFRRAIRVTAERGHARAEIEDDFHHFRVSVRHDGRRVTGLAGQALRYPWSQCPGAAGALPALEGLAIDEDPTAAYRHADPLGQCTHMLEAAALAVTQAARGPGSRRYDASVADPVNGAVAAELACDGEIRLAWTLREGVIVEPAPRRGERPGAIRSAALRGLPPGEAETLLIMRRVLGLAASRGLDVDRFSTAAEMQRGPACFVFRAGVAEQARRRYGSVRDFSTGPGPLPHEIQAKVTP